MDTKESYLSCLLNQINNPQVEISQKSIEKTKVIVKVLSSSKINRDQLEGLCFQGIPDECNGLRSLCWKVLLEYLPIHTSKWETVLKEYHQTYENYICEYFLPLKKLAIRRTTGYEGDPLGLSPGSDKSPDTTERPKERDSANSMRRRSNNNTKKRISCDFKVLNDDSLEFPVITSIKQNRQSDTSLWDDINKDAKRTRSGMDFFQKVTSFPLKKVYNKENKENFEKEIHMETLSRILFIYGKTHPHIGYVQGMNEILAPIYYCFSQDQNPYFLGNAEADSYFCFSRLMIDLQGSFLEKFDDTNGGIQQRIQYLNNTLQRTDRKLWEYLEKYNVSPQYYSLRWLMLLLTQEFEMNEVLQLWDILFSHPKKLIYLNYICLAMIQRVRGKLLVTEDFAGIMELLQENTTENFDKILPNAYKLYKLHSKENEIVHHIVFPI